MDHWLGPSLSSAQLAWRSCILVACNLRNSALVLRLLSLLHKCLPVTNLYGQPHPCTCWEAFAPALHVSQDAASTGTDYGFVLLPAEGICSDKPSWTVAASAVTLKPPSISKPDEAFNDMGLEFVETVEGIAVPELNDLFAKVCTWQRTYVPLTSGLASPKA